MAAGACALGPVAVRELAKAWGKPTKESSSWVQPSARRKGAAAKKDSRWDGDDNPKRSFTKSESFLDKVEKRMHGK